MMQIDVAGDRLVVKSLYTAREVMKSIPGSLWDKDAAAWTYPLIYSSVVSVVEAARYLGETLQSSERAKEWSAAEAESWAMLFGMAADVRGDRAQFEGGKLPTFFPHQLQGADWLAADGAEGGRLDAGETGSGKTATTIRAAWQCWMKGERGILLISTLSAVKHGWAAEVKRVQDELPLPDGAQWDVRVLTGTAAQRRKVFETLPDGDGGVGVVLITNHEQLRMHSRLSGYGDIALRRCKRCDGTDDVKESSCQAHEKELNKLPLVAFVVDEGHRFMEPKSQQTRAGWYLADHAPRTWVLTGTPGSTSVVENTWALLRLAVGARWPSKSKWCSYFANAGYNLDGYWEVGNLKPEREAEFRQMYGTLTRRVLKAQVLDLPPLLRGGPLERVVPMGREQRAAYDSMKAEMLVEMENNPDITASTLLVQTLRLLQLAQASGVPGPKWGEVVGINEDGSEKLDATMLLSLPSNKVDAVVDMVAGGDVPKGTVFQFVSRQLLYLVRDALVAKKVITHAGQFGVVAGGVKDYDRQLAIEGFQAGRIPFFGFTVAAGGAGITLTRASVMVAVERPWSPILWKQAEDRVHRIGSERHESVSIIDLLTEDSVEQRQMDTVLGNRESLESLVKDRDKLKELLS